MIGRNMAGKSSVFAILFPPLFIIFLAVTPAVRSGSDQAIDMKAMMEDMGRNMPVQCFTPPNLEEIFMRACEKVVKDRVTCAVAWRGFTSAFEFTDPNNVTGDDYKAYFEVLPISGTPNSVVFWSGVQGVIEEISNYPNITSSANEDASNIINTMTADDGVQCWCGNESAILDTTNPCPMTPTTVFWQELSCLLGESTTGITYWVGYGDREGGAYQSSSFFANYEFPKLTPDRVKRLVVVDIHKCGADIGEECGEGTLKKLQRQAERKYGRSAGYACYEVCGNPWDEQQVLSLANDTLDVIRHEQRECSIRRNKITISVQVGNRITKYKFSAGHPCVTYQCKFDDESFVNCTSPMTRSTSTLSRGRHQFVVVAKCDNNDSGARRKIRYRVR